MSDDDLITEHEDIIDDIIEESLEHEQELGALAQAGLEDTSVLAVNVVSSDELADVEFDELQPAEGDATLKVDSKKAAEDEDDADEDDDDVADDTDESIGAEGDATDEPEPLAPEKICRILQAVLLAAGEPMTIKRMLKLFKRPKPDKDLLKNLLKEIQDDYDNHDALRLILTAKGYQFQVADELSPWVLRLWEQKPPRYSRALLETLALIAYKQPITRGEIESVRGVSVSNHIMKTLLDREWIQVIGQREVPGRPCIYGTTKSFLDYFNLKRLADLPDLPEIQSILDEKTGVIDEDPPIQAELPLDSDEEGDEESCEDTVAEAVLSDSAQTDEQFDAQSADLLLDEVDADADIDTDLDTIADADAEIAETDSSDEFFDVELLDVEQDDPDQHAEPFVAITAEEFVHAQVDTDELDIETELEQEPEVEDCI